MTTHHERQVGLTIHRVVIMIMVLLGLWLDVEVLEQALFSVATGIWLWSSYLTKLEIDIYHWFIRRRT